TLGGLGMTLAAPFLGRLVDRFGTRRVILPAVVFFGVGVLSLYFLSTHLWHFYMIFLFMGVVGSGTTPVPYAISRYFGLRTFGEMYGYTFAAITLGGAVGPLVMGVSFDATGSYSLALLSLAGASFTAAGLMLGLGQYRVWEPVAEPVVAVGVSRA